MIAIKFKLLFVLVYFSLNTDVKCEPEVKLLHVLFRHGDKIPHVEYQTYPTDPHANHSYYPISTGGLTNEGKRREYALGTMLRKRYIEFLGSDYLPDAIYARSTSIPRAQMSLQLVLAALFPPIGQQIWNPDLPWQPVSVISEQADKDLLLFPQNCQLYKEEFKNFIQQKEIQRIVNSYSSTYAYLTKHTGKTINTASAVYYLYNLLKEEQAQNLTIPEWSSKVYPYPMENITILDFDLHVYTQKLKRLNGGILLRKITDDMKDFSSGCLKPSDRKAFFFSAHERNVGSLARTLGINDLRLPAYGSSIIIETLQDRARDNKYYVRVLVWTGVTERLITQKIPGCSDVCPLEEFLRLLKPVIPDDDEYYCRSRNSGSNIFSNNIWLLTALAISVSLGFGNPY